MLSISRSRHLDLANGIPPPGRPADAPSGASASFSPRTHVERSGGREAGRPGSVGLELAEQAMQPTTRGLETALDLVECGVDVIGGDLGSDLDDPFHQKVD
jgi:hypothetical protein